MTNENRLLGNIETGIADLRRDICRLEAKVDGLTERLDKRLVKMEAVVAKHSSQFSFLYGIGAVLSLVWSGIILLLGIKR